MRKRLFVILLAIMVVVMLFVGCDKESTTVTITSEKTKSEVGNYALFRTLDVNEYLTFLENFDETKYEIVDISTSYSYYSYGSDEFYIVTYKTISD